MTQPDGVKGTDDLVARLRFIADEYETAWQGRDVAAAVADLREAADALEAAEARYSGLHAATIKSGEEIRELWVKLAAAEARAEKAEKQRDLYSELAAGCCVIQKVIDELGPHSLVPSAELTRLRGRRVIAENAAVLERLVEEPSTRKETLPSQPERNSRKDWAGPDVAGSIAVPLQKAQPIDRIGIKVDGVQLRDLPDPDSGNPLLVAAREWLAWYRQQNQVHVTEEKLAVAVEAAGWTELARSANGENREGEARVKGRGDWPDRTLQKPDVAL